jgi:hypothetical protein
MAFDINIVLKQMTDAAISSLGKDAKNAATQTNVTLAAHRDVLAQISDLALAGDLTEEELRLEIREELAMFQTEMLAAKVADKAALQRAAHAAGEILMGALAELLP